MDKLPHPSRIFKTPNDLLEAWRRYKKSLLAKALEWPKIQYVGKDGTRVEDYPVLPITQEGFEVWYLDTYGHYIHQYFKNADGYYDDFLPICSYIEKDRRTQQITGGMLGHFNASITQRLNGLTETTKTELTGNLPSSVTFNFTDMSGDKTDEDELL